MPTDRFTYEGRHLREWLLQLVEEEPERRRKASKVIGEQLHAPMELLVDKGVPYDQLDREFKEAVRNAINDPAFPATEYVQKLLCLGIVLEKIRLNKLEAEFAADDQWHEEQHKKLDAHPSQKEFDRYMTRAFLRLMRQHRSSRRKQCDEALETGFGIRRVVDCLGPELLPAAEQIRQMFKIVSLDSMAADIICRMGETGLEFYPDLMEGLKLEDLNGRYSKPLGHVLRHAPERIPAIFELTGHEDRIIKRNAIKVLGYSGRETVRQFPMIEGEALSRLKNKSEEWDGYAWLLGKIAVTEEVVSEFLRISREPDNERRGIAINALGETGLDAERVVPRLIELIDEFEEYDPDWGYTGEHARIVEALQKFGSAAKLAIPKLATLIWEQPVERYNDNEELIVQRNPNQVVVELLGALGPEASEALPALREMKAKLIQRGVEETTEAGGEPLENPDDCCPDYVLEAIRKIGGA